MKKLIFHGEGIVTGQNSIEYLKELDIKRAFIVTGGASMIRLGATDKIKKIIAENQGETYLYSGIQKNPDTESVIDGLSKMKSFAPDTVIAVGGGSAIDAAKVMALFYDYPELNFENSVFKPLPDKRKGIKFIAIPSTSGTGTEVTKAAVITYKEKNLKIGLKCGAFIPDTAILDSSLTMTMPDNVVAETGMDALTHAVECFINRGIDDFTECLAKGAVEGIFKYLYKSFKEKDELSREKMHNYQCIAGCAFSNVGLGMAHGISHAFGGKFGFAHGLLNAVVLPYALEYNSKDSYVKDRLNCLGKAIDSSDFIQAVRDLNNSLNIPASFRELKLSSDDFNKYFDELVENSLLGATKVNPVEVTKKEMEHILTCIYEGRKI